MKELQSNNEDTQGQDNTIDMATYGIPTAGECRI